MKQNMGNAQQFETDGLKLPYIMAIHRDPILDVVEQFTEKCFSVQVVHSHSENVKLRN